MPARRRQQEPPPIEIKQFTVEEIERGIAKLRRRIDEVRTLQTDRVRYSDQRRNNAEENIRATILEVFGPNSPEYHNHQYHTIWYGHQYVNMSDEDLDQCFFDGIPQSITLVEGLIARLEEKRGEPGQDTTGRARAAFEGLDLHPRIAIACAELYRDGHYSNAVLYASIALVNFVKEKSGRLDKDGAGLMEEVFSPKNPVLAFNSLADQADLDEQRGMMSLFVGAVLAFRNPRAHKLLEDSPEAALEYIALLSFLAKRLDHATRLKRP